MQRVATVNDSMSGGEVVSEAPQEASKGSVLRLVILAVVLVGAVAVVHFSPLKTVLKDTEQVRRAIARMGYWAYPACLLASAVLVGCGFPRLVLCGAAALILGFWWGLVLTQGGALLGYYVVFCFIRWGGGEWIIQKRPKLRAIAETIQDQGVIGVVLARQIPIHGTLTNLCLGLSRVKHRHFLIGTAIGLFPEAIPVALVGAGLVKSSVKDSAWILGAAVVAFALIWVSSAYALRKMRKGRAEAIKGASRSNLR